MGNVSNHWFCCCSHRTGSLISTWILLILSSVSAVLYFIALFDSVIGHQEQFREGFYNVALYIHVISIFINAIIHTMCAIILFLAVFFDKDGWIACFSVSLLITTLLESFLASFTIFTYQTQTLPDTSTIADYPIILIEVGVCFVKTIFQIHLIIAEWCLRGQLRKE